MRDPFLDVFVGGQAGDGQANPAEQAQAQLQTRPDRTKENSIEPIRSHL